MERNVDEYLEGSVGGDLCVFMVGVLWVGVLGWTGLFVS